MSKSIEEKIIDVLFEKNRINFVMKDNLAKFLKEKYEPEMKKSKIRKSPTNILHLQHYQILQHWTDSDCCNVTLKKY